MTGIVLCLSAAAMGVDYGWQPVEGGIEYIIQIEPQLVDSLKAGRDIFSDLPKTAQRVRSYRITVGKGRLPHHGEPPPDSAVVPAGGEEATSTDPDQPAGDEQEIDLSQLPGPVLRPALTLGDGNPKGDDEPRHLAAETEPVANQVAGYHEASAQPPAGDADSHKSVRSEPSTKPSPRADKVALKSAAKAAQGDKQEQDHQEAASPSDSKPAATASVPAKPSAIQLGLFTSLACNAFLLWVATGQRSRYRALVQRMFAGPGNSAPALTAPDAGSPRWEQIGEHELPDDKQPVDSKQP